MKSLLRVFLFLFWANSAFAQTFQPIPDPVLEQEMAFNQANECYIFFDNPSGDTLQLRWRSLETSLPEGWIADLCDYGLCYAGIPQNGTMNPVYDTIRPYLKLIVQPGTTEGSAWLWFRVFEKDNESNYVDVFFSLFTPGTTSATEPQKMDIQIFPNPAFDVLFVENKGIKSRWLKIIGATSRIIWLQPVAAGEQKMIEVSDWPAGTYYLLNGRQTKQILIQR